MLSKKHRQSLRGLSHEQKVKKIQKITRVSLQNFKTNIAQSDLEEDDVSIPVSMKAIDVQNKENIQKPLHSQRKHTSRNKSYDQDRINRTIRAMTKQLYSLQTQNGQKQQVSFKRQAECVSSFHIQQCSFEFQNIKKSNQINKSTAVIEDFYSIEKSEQFLNQYRCSELSEISKKINNKNNMTINNLKGPIKRKQHLGFRQTQPLFFQQSPLHQPYLKVQHTIQPQMILVRNSQSSQSNLTKRFSRTKRNFQTHNEECIQKKLKFNRSNQKNKLITNIINKQNTQHASTFKQGLLTERMSYQHMSTYETRQTGLKKRKNVGRQFIAHQQNLPIHQHKQFMIEQAEYLLQQNIHQRKNNKVKNLLSAYQNFTHNPLFKQLSLKNVKNVVSMQKGAPFVLQLFNQYKQSIDLLRQFF